VRVPLGGLGEDPVAAGALEGVDLEVGLLVGGGDAGVAEQMAHVSTVAEPCDSGGCATLIRTRVVDAVTAHGGGGAETVAERAVSATAQRTGT